MDTVVGSPPTVAFRPVEDVDRPFLARLYASTRQEELAPVPWSAAEKEAFLAMQFDAQDRFYAEHFGDGDFRVVLVDGEPAGRLYLDPRPDEIRVVDIALLPAFRRRGIGRGLMRQVMSTAAASGRCVRIHVERNNPALRLYRRLGFREVDDQGVYLLMEWSPNATKEGAP